MTATDDRPELGRAIRRALEGTGHSQAWLGAEVAARQGRPDPYSQAIVSEWLSGSTTITPPQLFEIESALGLRAGSLSKILGYLPVSARAASSVAAAIESDAQLSPEGRAVVLAAYRAAVEASK